MPLGLCAPSTIVSGDRATSSKRPGTRDLGGGACARPSASSGAEERLGGRARRARSCAAGSAPRAASAHVRRRPAPRTSLRAAASAAATAPRPRASGCEPADDQRRRRRGTTASFSRAMSAIVGPSQRVCSRPTLVSTCTRDGDHVGRVVAAAEPGLDHGDVDAARGQLAEGGGRQHLELRHAVARRPGCGRPARRRARPRSTAAAKRARRRRRARRSARARRSSPGAARGRRRCAARGARGSPRSSRTVEDLPLVPTTWIDAKRSLRRVRARSSAGACGRARSACRTARARAGSASASAGDHGAPAHSASSSSRRRASFSRSASTTCAGALATKPSLASLPSARSISAFELAAALRAPALAPPRGRRRPRASTRTTPPGTATEAHRVGPVAGELEAREPRDAARPRLVVAVGRRAAPGRARRPERRRRRASCAAPARPRSAASTSPSASASRSAGSALGRPPAGQQPLLARAGTTRSPRSRTGSTGGPAPASRAARAAASPTASARRASVVQARLDQLQVPVAQLAVDEVVERRAPRARSRSRRSARATSCAARAQAREDPAVLDRRGPRLRARALGRRRAG